MSLQSPPDTDPRTDDRPAYRPYGCGGGLAGHLRVNLVVLAVLVGVWALTGADGFWPAWVALGMGTALAFKALVRSRTFRTWRSGRSRSVED